MTDNNRHDIFCFDKRLLLVGVVVFIIINLFLLLNTVNKRRLVYQSKAQEQITPMVTPLASIVTINGKSYLTSKFAEDVCKDESIKKYGSYKFSAEICVYCGNNSTRIYAEVENSYCPFTHKFKDACFNFQGYGMKTYNNQCVYCDNGRLYSIENTKYCGEDDENIKPTYSPVSDENLRRLTPVPTSYNLSSLRDFCKKKNIFNSFNRYFNTDNDYFFCELFFDSFYVKNISEDDYFEAKRCEEAFIKIKSTDDISDFNKLKISKYWGYNSNVKDLKEIINELASGKATFYRFYETIDIRDSKRLFCTNKVTIKTKTKTKPCMFDLNDDNLEIVNEQIDLSLFFNK